MKLYEGKWLRCGNSVLIVVLLGIASVVNAESSGPEPVQVPDIRANIMKMLQQSPAMEETGEEDLFAEAERQRKAKEQPPPPQVEEKEVAVKPAAAPAEKPVKEAEKPVAAGPAEKSAQKAGKPVELPVKEIVIENMDDLKKLAEELRKAKKRQTGRQ